MLYSFEIGSRSVFGLTAQACTAFFDRVPPQYVAFLRTYFVAMKVVAAICNRLLDVHGGIEK
jgi:hypothetical protein